MRAVILVLVSLTLAGCAQAPAPEVEPVVEVDSVTGAITGVVVDTNIVPVEGANVTLTPLGISVLSDENGEFAFDDLEPGVYFVSAQGVDFAEVQTNADVEPDVITKVRLQVERVEVATPYYVPFSFNGRITFHATVAWAQAEWMLDTYAGVTTPACEHCVHTFESEAPQGHVFEAIWENSVQDPRGPHENYWSYAVPDPYQELFGYAESPIYQVWDEAPFEETGEYKVMILGDADWIAVEESFEIFVTHWYNSPVPDGWSIVAGDS